MSLPFTIPNVHWGISAAQGTVWLTMDYLTFRVQTSLLHMVNTEPTTVKVSPEALRAVRLKRSLIGKDTLLIRPHAPDLLAEMPGRHVGAVELKVERKYRREAEALVAEVRDWARLDLYE